MRFLKRLISGMLLFLLIPQVSQSETPVSGTVFGIWDPGGSPYMVQGDLEVPADSLLIIKPGVWVIFEGDYEFVVDGTVLALGEEEDSIYFTTDPGVTWSGFNYFNNPDTSRFYYCLFENADTSPSGYGGVFYLYCSDMIVEHCTFQHNRANRGAAMYALWNYVSFRYNVCWDNRVEHCGGAINFGTLQSSVVERCLFYDNSAVKNPGGAIYFWDDHCQVINCTIVQNSSPAVLYINGSTSTFTNCIFWYNELGEDISATYCDIQGGWPGTGNIYADPMFVDPVYYNFHLLPGSPCIDTGDPSSPFDPDGTIADMGAYYLDQSGPGCGLTLELDPINPPIIIPPDGGTFNFSATITNVGASTIYFDAWTELLQPNGQLIGPILSRSDLSLSGGNAMFHTLAMTVSGSSMPGIYQLRGFLGVCQDTIWTGDSFTFEKEEGGRVDDQGDFDMILSGWDSEKEFHLPDWQEAGSSVNNHLFLTCTPNPFNPETVLQINLPTSGHVELTIYDLSGRVVSTLLDRHLNAGPHSITFDGSRLASGMYLAVVECDNQQAVLRLLLLK